MATEAPTSPSETSCDDNVQSKPKNFFGQNRALVLGCLIYFTYSMSISVDSQFLSLYYKSKGFDGSTLGVLYSITPLTTFLTIPLWSVVTRKGSKGKDDTPKRQPEKVPRQSKTARKNKKETKAEACSCEQLAQRPQCFVRLPGGLAFDTSWAQAF